MPRVTGPTSHEAIRRSLKSKFKLILSENKILVQIINGYVRQAEKLCRDLESAGDVTPKEFSKGMARLETVYSACVKLILIASELFEQDEKPKPRPVESTACESDSVGTNGTITYTEPHRPTPCPIDKDTKERLRALEDKLQEFESKQHKDLPEESLPTNLEKTQDDKVIDEPDLKNGGAGVDADGFIELERFLKELDKEYPMANSVSAKIITETAEKQETSTATSSCTSEGPAKPQLCPDANNSDLQDRFENLLIAVQSLAESCQGEGSVMKALTELRQLIQRQAEPGSVPEIKDSTPKKESVSFGFSPSPCFAYVNEDFTVDSSNDKFGNPRIAVFQTPMDIPPLEQKARFGENKKNCGPPQKQQQQPAWLSSDRFQLSRQKAKMCQPCVEQTNEKIPSLQHYSVQKYQQSEQEKKSEQQTESYRKQVFPSQNQEPAVSQPYSRQEVTDIMVNEMSEVLCSQFVPRLEVKYLERQVASVDSTDKFTRIPDDCNRFAAHPNVPVKTPRSHSLEGRGISNNLARQSQKKQINTIDTEHMENVMSIPGTGHRNVHLHSTQKGGCGPCHDYYLPNMENQTQQTQRPPLPRSYLVQKQQRQETHYQQPECLHGPLQDHHQQIRTQQQQVRQQQQQQQKQQHQQPQQQHHHQQLQQYQQQQQQQQHQLQQTRFTERAPPHEQHQWQKLCDHANKPSKLNYTLESNDVNCQDCEFHQHAPFEPHQLRQQQGHPYHEQQYRMAQACNNQQRMQNHITQDILDFDSTFPGVGSGEYIFQTMNVPLSTVYDSHGQTQSSRNSRLHDSFPPSYNDDSQSDYPTPNFYDPGTLPRPHSSYPKKNNPCATYGGQNSQVKTSTTEKSMVAPHADLHINPPPNCPCKAVRVDTHEDKDALKVPETRDSDREQDTPCSNIQQLSSEDHGASSNSEERPREVCGEMQSDNVPAEDKKAHGETRMKMYMDQQATLLPMRKEKIRGHSTGVSINATKSKGINETRTICITNLPFKMEEMRLLELLKQYGHVTKIYFIKHRHTGIFQGITYVKFSKQTEAVQAAQGLNKLIFDGNEIFAHLHTSKTPTVNESFRDS